MERETQMASAEVKNSGKPKPKRKWVKKVLCTVLVLALLCGTAVGAKTIFFSAEERIALTGTTTYGSLATTLEGTGTTMPADSYTVSAASAESKITGVFVSAGDTVSAGQLLYTQDDSELDEQLNEYQEQVDSQYEQIDSYTDQISDYNEQVEELRETMTGLTVTTPISGCITELTAKAGNNVQSGAGVAVVVDNSKMLLTEYFSYAYENDIYVGMPAGLSIPSLMRTVEGTVTGIDKVNRTTTEGTRTFAVTITVDNPGALTEGMTGAAWLTGRSGEKIYPAIEGELEYFAKETVTAAAGGEILTVNVKAYQEVSAGQTLLTVDGTDYQKQIDDLNDRIAQAREKITQTQESIAKLRERMAETEEKRTDYEVRSEIDGKVIMVNVREGETPRQGMTAVTIYNLDVMEISVNIDELDFGNISKDMPVRIVKSGSGGGGETYTGTITEISYEATNSDGVAYFPVVITIPADGALSAGVNVSYYIDIGDAEEGVLAPLAALKTTEQGTCLYVKADSRPENAIDLEDGVVPEGFYAVPVEVGATNSQYARIVSGVEQGVEVFTRYQNAAPSGGDTTSKGEEEGVTFTFPGGSGARCPTLAARCPTSAAPGTPAGGKTLAVRAATGRKEGQT